MRRCILAPNHTRRKDSHLGVTPAAGEHPGAGIMYRNPGSAGEALAPYVAPSHRAAVKYGRRVNVHRNRLGIAVRMNDECLRDLSGDEILADIYEVRWCRLTLCTHVETAWT